MTVRELIAELQRYDGELPVFVIKEAFEWPEPISEISKTEIENTELVLLYAYDD